MTTQVITVTPDTPVPDIARLLLDNGISALPVVNTDGEVIGMVSEGDLIGRSEMQRLERRDWWLNLLAEGEALAPEFLTHIQSEGRKANDIMSSPVVTVTPTTEIPEIAHLLTEYHIKRVPVVRDNRIVGIVSRADLVRALAAQAMPLAAGQQSRQGKNMIAKAFTSMDHYFHTLSHQPPPKMSQANTTMPSVSPDAAPTAKEFQSLVADFAHAKVAEREAAHDKIAEQHKQQVGELINHHIDDAIWQAALRNARVIAQQGGKEYMLLRFPDELCSDGGRAINIGEHSWPETLRGEAAEIYLRWEQDLKPQGFHLSARVLEYPGGMPGDIGLFLVWGGNA